MNHSLKSITYIVPDQFATEEQACQHSGQLRQAHFDALSAISLLKHLNRTYATYETFYFNTVMSGRLYP